MAKTIIDVDEFNGNNGFVISADNQLFDYDALGESVSNAGDINGDGLDDFIVGAPNAGLATVAYNDYYDRFDVSDRRGAAYVIFGRETNFAANFKVNALDGENGFTIEGLNVGDRLGSQVSGAEDVNGDGFNDLLVSTPDEVHLIFGREGGFAANFDLNSLDGSNGFTLQGEERNYFLGYALSSAGDLNGDGFDDFIIGADGAGELLNETYYAGTTDRRGEAYVVFGRKKGFTTDFDLTSLDGTNGFSLRGKRAVDLLGNAVSNAGDINGDGLDDLVVGAPGAGDNVENYNSNVIGDNRGKTYVIFGRKKGFTAEFDLDRLDGSNGFSIEGLNRNESLGSEVANAGDVNGDGFDDFMVGTTTGISNINSKVYVIFGGENGFTSEFDLNSLDGSNGFVVRGMKGGKLGSDLASAGDVNGDGFSDIVIGAPDVANKFGGDSSYFGVAYVLFGSDDGFAPAINITALSAENGFTVRGVSYNGGLGTEVSNAGDINGDGLSDIILGAPSYAIRFTGYAGNAYVIYGSQTSVPAGTNKNDTIAGSSGNDRLSGLAGNDKLRGLDGNDTLIGASGRDRLLGNNGKDVLYGGVGSDTLNGGNGSDRVLGNPGRDLVYGGTGNDTLSGGTAKDTLVGGRGNDRLNGEAGNDRLIGVALNGGSLGSSEQDTLTGGNSSDIFVLGNSSGVFYDDGDNSTAGDRDLAYLTDFNPQQDKVQLAGTVNEYLLDFVPSSGDNLNAQLFYAPEAAVEGELIALIENVSANLNLNDKAFIFV
ncbi:FG-GAP repeat protein [Myxosarcina sp. GI1]|uniref:calcium-binding protein n=1 Tax=Myxosarcina sp. GI1 TaxID=1541065 RepID=UPI00068AB1B5|nr:FG-GAP repeat protein [Myxosarcina sp. GI1]